MSGYIRRLIETPRRVGFSKLESAILLGAPVIGALAPPVFVATQMPWSENSLGSAIMTAVSCAVSPFTAYGGFIGGCALAAALKVSRSVRRSQENYSQSTQEDRNYPNK